MKWFVGQQISRGVHIAAIEVQNEPNNSFSGVEGTNWESQLVALSNSVADAIHSLNANVPLIGLGGQGQQILYMLALHSTHLNVILYNPNDHGNLLNNLEYTNHDG